MFVIETDRWGGDRDAEHISVLQHAPLEERLTVKRIGCVSVLYVWSCLYCFCRIGTCGDSRPVLQFRIRGSLFAFFEINTPCECDLFQIISPNFYAIVKCRFNRLRYFSG